MLPRVKKYESNDNEKVIFPMAFGVSAEEYKTRAVELLKLFCENEYIGTDCDGFVKILKSELFDGERYSISVTGNGVEIRFGEYIGLRNALATFSQMIKEENGKYCVSACYIEDYPDVDFRGVMLDLARGTRDIKELKRDMVLIARAKMKYMHFHLLDEKGVCYKMDCLPQQMCIENAYTKEQIEDIVDFAERLGMEIIPEFDMPGHSLKMAESYPELSCDVPQLSDPSKWAVCAGTEKAYDMYECIIKEMSETFKGRYFHMGGDELEFGTPNMREKNLLCLWDDCVKCKALREREGLKDRQEQYYYFANRINKIAKKYNRQMIMWSDQLDCTRPKGLDDDIIMQFWRVACEHCGPSEGCSMKGQLEFGYKMINSQFEETYIDEPVFMQSDRLEKWEYNKIIDTEEYSDSIIGSEACAWEYGNPAYKTKYDRGLASAVYLIADRLWDASPVEYDREYAKKLTDAVLGASTPLELNLFDALGDLIPNEEKLEKRIDRVKATESELKRITEFLCDNSKYKGGNLDRAKAYAELVEEVIALKSK